MNIALISGRNLGEKQGQVYGTGLGVQLLNNTYLSLLTYVGPDCDL